MAKDSGVHFVTLYWSCTALQLGEKHQRGEGVTE